jgi:hypothetical protein
VAERRHNLRTAKMTFWVVGLVGWPVIATIASAITDTALAVVIGLLAALALAVATSFLVWAWPVLRILWHWAAEIILGVGMLGAYLALTQLAVWWLALTILALGVGGPLLLPFTRTAVLPVAWCAVSRHRLRLCFTAFIRSNRHGTVPFILLARPTPAGERIWVWLRPGLSIEDLEQRRDKIAVACWAKDVRLTPGSKRNSARLRVDITRRNPLTATIGSPLTHLIPDIDQPSEQPVSASVSTALDLPDVPEALFLNPDRTDRPVDTKPSASKGSASLSAVNKPNLAATNGDDITDWM